MDNKFLSLRMKNNELKKKDDSKEKLKKICITKIKTTMIGALSIVENEFKKLKELDSDMEEFLDGLFQHIRQEILDKGNTQIRNLESEFEQYNIEWTKYKLDLPVKNLGNGD